MSLGHFQLERRRWARVRRAVFQRDKFRCQSCGKAGRLECDHVVPLKRGGDAWAKSNLQTLCRSCHIEKTGAENRASESADTRRWRAVVNELAN